MNLEDCWRDMESSTDGWNWYWLPYGEKCYGFAVVTAYPDDDTVQSPPAGGKLYPHPTKERLWVAEDGTEMIVDEFLVDIEQQNGDSICRFIAQAFADAQKRFGKDNKMELDHILDLLENATPEQMKRFGELIWNCPLPSNAALAMPTLSQSLFVSPDDVCPDTIQSCPPHP